VACIGKFEKIVSDANLLRALVDEVSEEECVLVSMSWRDDGIVMGTLGFSSGRLKCAIVERVVERETLKGEDALVEIIKAIGGGKVKVAEKHSCIDVVEWNFAGERVGFPTKNLEALLFLMKVSDVELFVDGKSVVVSGGKVAPGNGESHLRKGLYGALLSGELSFRMLDKGAAGGSNVLSLFKIVVEKKHFEEKRKW